MNHNHPEYLIKTSYNKEPGRYFNFKYHSPNQSVNSPRVMKKLDAFESFVNKYSKGFYAKSTPSLTMKDTGKSWTKLSKKVSSPKSKIKITLIQENDKK